jgi:hypothetical protein
VLFFLSLSLSQTPLPSVLTRNTLLVCIAPSPNALTAHTISLTVISDSLKRYGSRRLICSFGSLKKLAPRVRPHPAGIRDESPRVVWSKSNKFSSSNSWATTDEPKDFALESKVVAQVHCKTKELWGRKKLMRASLLHRNGAVLGRCTGSEG